MRNDLPSINPGTRACCEFYLPAFPLADILFVKTIAQTGDSCSKTFFIFIPLNIKMMNKRLLLLLMPMLLAISILKAQEKNEERFHNDWANFARYRDANEALAKITSSKPRVVFMGNSITDGWINADSSFFVGKNYIDCGISGQTTPQMLLRFRSDVIDLKPAVVVILAGINDIAGNTGPMTLEETYGNIVSMAQLAKASDIPVVISSVLPAYDFPWRPGMEPANKVIELNKMLKDYCDKHNIVYLDYFNAMKDERNGLPANLSHDGVHPTLAGYRIMERLAEKAIAQALQQK